MCEWPRKGWRAIAIARDPIFGGLVVCFALSCGARSGVPLGANAGEPSSPGVAKGGRGGSGGSDRGGARVTAGGGSMGRDGNGGSGGPRGGRSTTGGAGTAGVSGCGETPDTGPLAVPAFKRRTVELPLDQDAYRLESGDMNSDCRPDIVMSGGFAVGVLPGGNARTFGQVIQFDGQHSGSGVSDVALGDFDGDARLDVAIVAVRSTRIVVGLGAGDGTIASSRVVDLYPWDAGYVVAADFNRDGLMDFAHDNLLGVVLGSRDASFVRSDAVRAQSAYAAGSLVAADFREDGNIDLLAGPEGVFVGLGDGTFEHRGDERIETFYSGSFQVADVNSDGHVDLVESDFGRLTVSFGDGTGGFVQQPLPHPEWVLLMGAGDLNLDGHVDLVLGLSDAQAVEVTFGRGDATFGGEVRVGMGDAVLLSEAVIADFDRDGRPDIAMPALDVVEVLWNVSR